MTARQQIARLLPLVLLVVLVIAGLRGAVAAPRWDGPLRSAGVPIGLALEVVLAVLLVVTLRRDGAARSAAEKLPYTGVPAEIRAPAALRFVLKYVLGGGLVAVAVVLISDLHLHFLGKPPPAKSPTISGKLPTPPPASKHGNVGSGHFPFGPILYTLLVLALVAAVVISVWWARRLRLPAAPLPIAELRADELRDAVESGHRRARRRRRPAHHPVLRGAVLHPPADRRAARRGQRGARRTGRRASRVMSTQPARENAKDTPDAEPGRWHEATPELIIAAIAVAAAALAGAAVSGWPGVVAVAAVTTVLALLLLRALIPRSAAQSVRVAKDKQQARAISGYGQRRFTVATSVTSRSVFEADLRPVLEHILAARLADSRGVNLYTEPDQARAAFCRTRADETLWAWIDPRRVPETSNRAAQQRGISRRTLARLITRLEQL